LSRKPRLLALAVTTVALLAAPTAASGAVVGNGDFETGNLSGWNLNISPDNPFQGSWFAYSGTQTPLFDDPVAKPPQGQFAAVTDQGGPGRRVIHQKFTLPSTTPVSLSFFVYYRAYAPIASPNTLSYTGPPNEQYRIDLMRPSAHLASLAPGDVLLNVFRTVTGDPQALAPTRKVVDISALAGQTVRLRLAEVDNQNVFNASADAISVQSATPPNPSTFTLGSPIKNKKKGTALLPVTVSDAGTLSLTGTGVKPQSVPVGSAGTVNLPVKATGKKKKKLKKKGKAGVDVTVTYTPNGLSPKSEESQFKLKKKRKKHKK
jgi:hypothetical protein